MRTDPYPTDHTQPKPPPKCDCRSAVERCHAAALSGDTESRQLLAFLVLRAGELRAMESKVRQPLLKF